MVLSSVCGSSLLQLGSTKGMSSDGGELNGKLGLIPGHPLNPLATKQRKFASLKNATLSEALSGLLAVHRQGTRGAYRPTKGSSRRCRHNQCSPVSLPDQSPSTWKVKELLHRLRGGGGGDACLGRSKPQCKLLCRKEAKRNMRGYHRHRHRHRHQPLIY